MPTGVYKRTVENRKNISKVVKGRKLSFEAKKKISEAVKKRWHRGDRVSPMLGKYQSFGAKAKMRKARLERKRILGYINSKETRERIGKSLKGRRLPIETKIKLSCALKGRKKPIFTEAHKRKLSESLKGRPQPWNSGNNSHFWKGGISELSKHIKVSLLYRNWRESVFKRDDWSCQKCHKRGGRVLHPHHKKSFTSILEKNKIKTLASAFQCEELWNVNNGITLCEDCHKSTETYGWNNYNKNLKHL